MKNRNLLFMRKCNCASHSIELELDEDKDLVYVYFWYNHRSGKYTFWDKLKFVWNFVFGDSYWMMEDLVLDKDDVGAIANELKRMEYEMVKS